ncbi:hypothetical protein [Bradyrhizobium sp.]
MATQRIASGQTTPGATAWQPYQGSVPGVYVDVDTTSGKFSSAPVYVTSIGGKTTHWATTGDSSVYPTPPAVYPTATGFRVYLKFVDNGPITPATANSYGWHVNWIGMEL